METVEWNTRHEPEVLDTCYAVIGTYKNGRSYVSVIGDSPSECLSMMLTCHIEQHGLRVVKVKIVRDK